jgi:translation initiation factor IF-1
VAVAVATGVVAAVAAIAAAVATVAAAAKKAAAAKAGNPPSVFLRRQGASCTGAPCPALTRNFSHSFMAEQIIETEGKITEVLPGTMFRVTLSNTNNHTVLAHISGKMRKRFIRLTNGDRVKLEMSPYDINKARIVYRLQ